MSTTTTTDPTPTKQSITVDAGKLRQALCALHELADFHSEWRPELAGIWLVPTGRSLVLTAGANTVIGWVRMPMLTTGGTARAMHLEVDDAQTLAQLLLRLWSEPVKITPNAATSSDGSRRICATIPDAGVEWGWHSDQRAESPHQMSTALHRLDRPLDQPSQPVMVSPDLLAPVLAAAEQFETLIVEGTQDSGRRLLVSAGADFRAVVGGLRPCPSSATPHPLTDWSDLVAASAAQVQAGARWSPSEPCQTCAAPTPPLTTCPCLDDAPPAAGGAA